LLHSLGLTVSISAASFRQVSSTVRGLDFSDCARFARRVMEQSDPARIRELVAGFAAGAGDRG
jgi:phosphoenolpyruvate-protein kinase (PTS system EI component)